MSASLGLSWGEEQPSASRMNAKSLFYGTGDDIATITISSPIALALCTEDGSGFLANHVYFRHFDDTAQQWSGWDDVFRKHTHADDTEEEGGDYYDIDIANASSRLSIIRPSFQPEMVNWFAFGSNATVENVSGGLDINYTRLRTGIVANNYAQLQDGGLKASLSSKMEWHAKFEIDIGADPGVGVLWRMGVGMEKASETSESTLQKFGIEGCSGDGETIQLVSCDGATRLKTNTAVGMEQGAAIGAKISYVPSTSVIYEDTLSTVKASTGAFPSSGAIDSDKMLRYGIKTTNTTECLMYIWADALFGKINDPSWI